MLTDPFVVFLKRPTFSTLIGENKHIYCTYADPISQLWSCYETIFLLVARKEQLLMILCGLLLAAYRWFLYLVFVFLLGAICTREALRYDFLIAEKVTPLSVSNLPCKTVPPTEGLTRGGFPTLAHIVDVVW